MTDGTGSIFLVVGVMNTILGILFLANVRNLGVRYIRWYRQNWSWRGGYRRVRGPRATNAVARATGALWLASGIFGIVVGVVTLR